MTNTIEASIAGASVENIRVGRSAQANLFWLMLNQAVAFADGILVGALVARYLGPERLGYFSYGLSIVAISVPCVQLGLDRILVRNFVQQRERRCDDFWAAVALRSTTAVIFFVVLFSALVADLFSHQNVTEFRILAISFALILVEPLETVRLLLEAEVASYLMVWVSTLWRLIFALIRIWLVMAAFSAESLVAAHVLLAFATSITLFGVVRATRLLPIPRLPKTEHIRKLFSESWPLAVSALAVAMYMNIDVTMLMMMSGPGEAGVYSVAVQMSSVFYFLPLAMYSSFFPTMANSFSSNRDEFQPQYAKYVDLNVVFAYASIGIGWLAFPILIRFFFGNQYDNSVQPFQIHIFGLVFVFLGVSRGVFLTLHGLHRFAMLSTIAGAITNIAMNLLLIPEYKSDGAAAATIASHGVAAVLTSFCNSRTRVVGRQQLGAALLLNPLRRILRSATRS